MAFENDYPVDASAVTVPAGLTADELLARRAELLARVIELVPGEARAEIEHALTPPTVNLIVTVPVLEVASLIAEIYAIDQVLPPGMA